MDEGLNQKSVMLNVEELIDNQELFDGHYALIRPLSVDGATADVWLALDTNTVTEEVHLSDIIRLNDDEIEKLGLMVAIKIYRPQNALDVEGEQRFRDEYTIVFNCHHTNLIHPTQYSIFKQTPYLVLPYCKRGSSELLVGNLTQEHEIWKYINDVASGLAYLHNNCSPPIIHQDIKPGNVLLDDYGNYSISDFGISVKHNNQQGHYDDNDHSGTYAYMAPERFKMDCEPSAESDIWAFGATLYELITGVPPFGESGGELQSEGEVSLKFEGLKIPTDIKRLIEACLNYDLSERPTAAIIKEASEQKRFPLGNRNSKKRKIILFFFLIVCFFILGVSIPNFFEDNIKNEQANSFDKNTSQIETVKEYKWKDMTYSGDMIHGIPNGKGHAIYSDGREYEGMFIDGYREDKHARFIYTDKKVFEGEFAADTIKSGRVTTADGEYTFEGAFFHGAPYNGFWYKVDDRSFTWRVVNGENQQ